MNQLQKNNVDNISNNGKGIGRGRGWLKLNENTVQPQDALLTQPGGLQELNVGPNNNDLTRLIDLINEIEIESYVTEETTKKCANEFVKLCRNQEDLQSYLTRIHEHALTDTKFALKYVTFVSKYTKKIHDLTLMKLFINNAQTNYENIDVIRKISEEQSRNAILMFACWLTNRDSLQTLVRFLSSYLEKLLNYRKEADLKLFAKLLYKSYNKLKTTPYNNKCIRDIHKVLAEDGNNLNKNSRMWLLLALECRGGIIDKDVLKYYDKEFGKQEMSYFQKNYYANLNVADKPLSDILPKYYLSEPSLYKYELNRDFMYTLEDYLILTQPATATTTTITTNANQLDANKIKKQGRPILGTGVGLYIIPN